MKGSDSTNSLTGLNPSESSEEMCFICLDSDIENGEPLVDSRMLRNCGCKFHVHPACWNLWMKDKSHYDCPICQQASVHRIGMPPSPILTIAYVERERRSPWLKWKLLLAILGIATACYFIASIILWGK